MEALSTSHTFFLAALNDLFMKKKKNVEVRLNELKTLDNNYSLSQFGE